VRLSVLVVSRTAARLSAMLKSLATATKLRQGEVEILCSWNGTSESEQEINNQSGYEFLIAQRDPYHFANNMNQLAHNANGDVLAFINDDVILDVGSLDEGLSCLFNDSSTLCVGALLRTPDGNLQHGGMGFDLHHTPYHIAEGLVSATDVISELQPYEVPGVTAAVMLIRKTTFIQQPFDESYNRCGEDVQLNLDLREKLKGRVMLCPSMSGVHIESATRAENDESGNTSEDLVKMRTRRRLFLEQASAEQLRVELSMATREQAFTKEVMAMERNHLRQQREAQREKTDLVNLEREKDHWKRQAQVLQLEALRLQDSAQRQRGV